MIVGAENNPSVAPQQGQCDASAAWFFLQKSTKSNGGHMLKRMMVIQVIHYDTLIYQVISVGSHAVMKLYLDCLVVWVGPQ